MTAADVAMASALGMARLAVNVRLLSVMAVKLAAPLASLALVWVGYLTGDVDGSFAGATGSSSLTKTYFDTLVAAHPTELSLTQFGVY